MLVDGFACHEQMHDFARSLENSIDPAVTHHPFDADGHFPASFERTCRFVTSPAANLQSAVNNLPFTRGIPFFRGGRFESYVVTASIGHLARELPDRIHRERSGRQVSNLMGNRFVFANRYTPLAASIRPAARDVKTLLNHPRASRRDGQTNCVERNQRDLQALALLADQVFTWNTDIAKTDHAVS